MPQPMNQRPKHKGYFGLGCCSSGLGCRDLGLELWAECLESFLPPYCDVLAGRVQQTLKS